MNDLLKKISFERKLTAELREEVRKTFGNRGARALAAIDEQRVRRYLDFIVVKSTSKEYVVDEDICTCDDFLFRERECWHILAVRIALATGMLLDEESWYQEHWFAETDKSK
jgi:predicted nucleic acid-binding Zn finger protein